MTEMVYFRKLYSHCFPQLCFAVYTLSGANNKQQDIEIFYFIFVKEKQHLRKI